MRLVDWRIAWSLQRFEIACFLLATIVLCSAAFFLGAGLAASAPSPDCFRAHLSNPVLPPGCASVEAFMANQPPALGWVFAGFAALPFASGAVLGSQVVAREIDRRTAEFAWWAEPSRIAWLRQRVVPLVLILLAGTAIATIAATYLETGVAPWIDPGMSFHDYGTQGPLPGARLAATFLLSVLAGSVVGRTLPALLVSGGLALALLVSLTGLWPFGQPLEVLPVPIDSVDGSLRADVGITQMFASTTGEIVSAEQARSSAPPGDDPDSWVTTHFREVWVGIPGERLTQVEIRESLVLLVVASISGVLALVVVRGRRPT